MAWAWARTLLAIEPQIGSGEQHGEGEQDLLEEEAGREDEEGHCVRRLGGARAETPKEDEAPEVEEGREEVHATRDPGHGFGVCGGHGEEEAGEGGDQDGCAHGAREEDHERGRERVEDGVAQMPRHGVRPVHENAQPPGEREKRAELVEGLAPYAVRDLAQAEEVEPRPAVEERHVAEVVAQEVGVQRGQGHHGRHRGHQGKAVARARRRREEGDRSRTRFECYERAREQHGREERRASPRCREDRRGPHRECRRRAQDQEGGHIPRRALWPGVSREGRRHLACGSLQGRTGQEIGEEAAGVGLPHLRHLLGRARGHHPAARRHLLRGRCR